MTVVAGISGAPWRLFQVLVTNPVDRSGSHSGGGQQAAKLPIEVVQADDIKLEVLLSITCKFWDVSEYSTWSAGDGAGMAMAVPVPPSKPFLELSSLKLEATIKDTNQVCGLCFANPRA